MFVLPTKVFLTADQYELPWLEMFGLSRFRTSFEERERESGFGEGGNVELANLSRDDVL